MISVIVIVYNSAKTILETLESIYNQTFEDIELIISDDGSTDNTISLAETWTSEHQKRFKKIQILQSENTGVTGNCNRGLFASSGTYIQFIAGDDILLPNALEVKYHFMETHPIGMVLCKIELFGEDSELVEKMRCFCERGYEIINQGYEYQKEQILYDNYVGPGAFHRASFIKGINGFDERYPMLEDYPYYYHYLYGGNELVLIDEVLQKYRISNKSLCQKNRTPMNISQANFFFNERMKELWRRKKYLLFIRQTGKYIRKKVLERVGYYD